MTDHKQAAPIFNLPALVFGAELALRLQHLVLVSGGTREERLREQAHRIIQRAAKDGLVIIGE